MPDRPLILPPLRRTAADAEAFARIVHDGQVDKAGRPYVEHLERVAREAERASNSRVIALVTQIAWLHDVIEDTAVSSIDLVQEGFSPHVAYGVEWLTKERGMAYAAFIDGLCRTAPLPVLLVKIADIEDNSDPKRLALLPEEVQARLRAKYEPALVMLKDAAVRMGWEEPGRG